MPHGIKGEFGPGIKSLIITLNHVANVSEPKIHELLENVGVHISRATISRILTKDTEIFHQEKAEIFQEGLKATPYQQIDDTGARINGVNHYTQILCNPYYAAYFTVPNKNRETILDILLCGKEKVYCFNDEAFDLMETFNVSQIWMEKLSSFKTKYSVTKKCVENWIVFSHSKGTKLLRKKFLKPVQLRHIIRVQTYLWLPHF
ncbi:Mobile element protein [Methanosarcina lacustris Z-7289]|uniref:Mobile element protein n=1 Tax=Methanosarcina lacustris Z-7289 TaxID=1434111 RepID=A0A0E3S6F2_9EURY|nr:Mobile element protein [Methanosarcina lacustris Z-7289]